jgi:hypothetical protein
MRWDASAERLGIGTSSPSANLEVIGTTSIGTTSISTHLHSPGGGTYTGEFYPYIQGTSWTDVARINFDNASWGGVSMSIRFVSNSNNNEVIYLVYKLTGHAAFNGGNVAYTDITGNGVGYLNWVNESNGNLKLQMKTQYSTDDAAIRITYETNHRTSQIITVDNLA